MLEKRLRFAPSPTGPLHIGGLRTALYNYLISKNQKGKFILRIEDTDLKRFDKKAEKHIMDCLNWCGIFPDESPMKPGKFGPYRQSERKSIYKKHIKKLIDSGKAYYAFDSVDDLDKLRKEKEKKGETFIYNWENRENFINSLTVNKGENKNYINDNYVVRFKSYDKDDSNDKLKIKDEIRGEIEIDLKLQDDKIIFKNDGMPTYHLANVVDDHLMKISDVVRGEEWLPSLPLHWQLYESFGWEKPNFAHLPLILKPTGKGKLSKRDGQKFGIPVYPINWNEDDNIVYEGFKEIGFEKTAFINFVSMIGWNPGNEEEIFDLDVLVNQFSINRIIKSGAKYDYEKAKWFNIEHLKKISNKELITQFKREIEKQFYKKIDISKVDKVIEIVRERVEFRKNIIKEIHSIIDYNISDLKENISKINFNSELEEAIKLLLKNLKEIKNIDTIKNFYFNEMKENNIKIGDGMRALRVCISGKKSGADLFSLINIIKREIIIQRINNSLNTLNDKNWNS